MNKIDEVVADLEPGMLSRLAEDAYARNRHDDLARAAADARRPMTARPQGRWASLRKTRWLPLAGAAAAVGAAATVAVALSLPAGSPPAGSRPAGHKAPPGRPAAAVSARTVLLAAAGAAAHAPAATGTYWYVKERNYGAAVAMATGAAAKRSKWLFFGATFGATEESWTGQSRARTIINEDLVITFESPADRARWVAAGKPPLFTPAGLGAHAPVTSDYAMTFRWGVGTHRLSLKEVQRLPVTASGLGKVLRNMWAHEPDKTGAVGLPRPSFGEYLVQWADALLTGPARPGTRAAIYRLLADQPGLPMVPGVTDPLGRTGVAVGDGGGDYLIIEPATARLLAYTGNPVHANSVLPPSAGLAVYGTPGWTDQPGVAP